MKFEVKFSGDIYEDKQDFSNLCSINDMWLALYNIKDYMHRATRQEDSKLDIDTIEKISQDIYEIILEFGVKFD